MADLAVLRPDLRPGYWYNEPAVERATFVQHILSAVAHLDDHTVLNDHPLASIFFAESPVDERGRELRDLLHRTIGELQPADVTETNSGPLRRYQYLDLRYLRGHRAAHVAQDLGLSDRQARRIHQEAIEALAALVWAHRRREARTPTESARAGWVEDRAKPTSELEAEVSRLGVTPAMDGTSLSEVLRSTLTTVAPLSPRHGVEVVVSAIPTLPLVAVDRAVLRQVLVNLLVALIETTTRHLEVDVQPRTDVVELRFTTHFQTPAASLPNPQPHHDELLQVVRRLVQLQAGTVTARSIDPATSVVELALPVVQPATILLVDDNPDTLRLFRRYLSGGNYRTIEASDGRQALEIARQSQPRAIVLDVMLPSQDGWEILQALRNDLTTANIPVIICSVLHQEELAQALSATAYLTKPVSREELLATLRRVLTRPAPSPAPVERPG